MDEALGICCFGDHGTTSLPFGALGGWICSTRRPSSSPAASSRRDLDARSGQPEPFPAVRRARILDPPVTGSVRRRVSTGTVRNAAEAPLGTSAAVAALPPRGSPHVVRPQQPVRATGLNLTCTARFQVFRPIPGPRGPPWASEAVPTPLPATIRSGAAESSADGFPGPPPLSCPRPPTPARSREGRRIQASRSSRPGRRSSAGWRSVPRRPANSPRR